MKEGLREQYEWNRKSRPVEHIILNITKYGPREFCISSNGLNNAECFAKVLTGCLWEGVFLLRTYADDLVRVRPRFPSSIR